MGLRYQKRINLGNGFGLNVSKSGISSSFKTKYGTIGTKGFSIRTGIPGLTIRKYYKGTNKKNSNVLFYAIILVIGVLIIAFIVIWNIFRFSFWVGKTIYLAFKRQSQKRKLKKAIMLQKENPDNIKLLQFSLEEIPVELKDKKAMIENIFVKSHSIVDENSDLASIQVDEYNVILSADMKGKVTFYKRVGEQLYFNEPIGVIEKV
jgi:hypothetical protein